MRRDSLRRWAAYPCTRWVLRTGPSRRMERPDTREEGSLANRHRLQALAGAAGLRRPAYPVAEF